MITWLRFPVFSPGDGDETRSFRDSGYEFGFREFDLDDECDLCW